MSSELVKKIERMFYNNARKSFVIPDWKGVFFKRVFKNPSSQLFLYFFRKCSEQFLTCQDQTGSCILHGLVKSQLPTTAKIKVFKIVIDRGINVNQLDGTKRTVLDYLIENNDIECIEVLLKHSHCLQISDKYLLLLQNTQKEVCEMLFKYADKHKIAPHLTHPCYYKIISILKSQCTKSDDVKENNLNENYHIALKDDLNSLQDLLKNSSPHISSGQIKLPNHEEYDRMFEISTTDQEDVKRSIKRSEKKLTRKSLVKTAKTKKYLNTKEAVAYMHSMKQKRLNVLQFEIKNTPASNDRCCKDDLSGYKVLGVGSYGIVYEALCNGQPCVAKARNPSITKANNEQILQEIEILKSLNHHNVVQFVGTYYHGNTPLLVMEEMWLNLSKWLKINPSASLKNKFCILIDVTNGLQYLHSQNMIHCDLIANNILLTTNLQAKIGDFGMAKTAGQNMIQVPSDFSHIPPEARTHDSICTKKLDIFSFGCVMIHTITQEFPAVNEESCVKDTEIKRRSEYLNKIKGFSLVYSIILHCLQDNPLCQPSANKLHYLFNACVVLKSHYYSDELLKHKEIGQGSYSSIHPCVGKVRYPFIIKNSAKNCNSSKLVPSLRSLDYTNVIHFLYVYNMSALYKADSLVFGRSVSNLVYQATGNLLKDLVYVIKTLENYLLLWMIFDDVPQLVRENLLEDNKDKVSTPCQAVSSSFQHNKDILYVSTTQRNYSPLFEETNSEASIDTCVNEYYESLDFRVNSYDVESEGCGSFFLSTSLVECISTNGQESFQHVGEPSESSSLNVIGQRIYSPFHAVPTTACINLSVINVTALQDGILSEKEKSRTRGFGGAHDEDSFVESESCDSLYRFANSTTPYSFPESSTSDQDSFQHVEEPSESFSYSVIGQKLYSPYHAISTISCSNLTINKTVLQDGILTEKQKNRTRGYGDGSSDSSSDEDNNGEDKRGIHTSLVSHYHSHNPQQHSSPRYHSLSAAVNTNITPQTAAGAGLVGSKHDGRLREVATAKPFIGMGVTLPKSPAMYASKGEYLISNSLNERGPILLDIPNGRNELVMAAYSTQSIPKLYPIIGLRKELPGIALPPPIPLDLPKLHPIKKETNIASHQQVVREQPVKSSFDVGTVPEAVPGSNVQQPQYMASVASHEQQQAQLSQSMDFSDPVIIIDRAALFLTAADYGATIKVLEILDKHLVLPEDIDMAKEFGQGLANYKNLHYKAAKSCFTALFEKSNNYGSPGNQALASIYLGEIEMSWAKYKDAEKHFTLAVTNYSPDNVAEKYQQTKSAVLVKKGQCHRSLSQIKEAINAFKVAKEVAELAQQQARGSKLKTAKEDELSAVCALGNILQSLGDYDQSFDYYEKSLKLADELGDQVSIGWAHGNLGNAMLGLDQKDKALDHLITAFHMSTRYEGNPLATGRAVSNLGNAYQAIGNLPNAKEHYEIALGHAIYGNDLQGQGRACGNIGNTYMLLKEPVQAVHYYTETLRLSTNRNTNITGHHNRGCARFDVAECIIQGKKPKELVTAITQNSEYGRLTIKLTDEVITTDPVQETKPNRDPSAQSISEQKESSISVEMLPVVIKGKVYEGVASVEVVRMAEALLFLETARHDLLEAIELHEERVQNVKGSHEALSLFLSLFESNSQSFYKMQETLIIIELGKLCQRLARLGLIDMTATEQEFKDALVYGEQARARTLGELILQKKKTMYSDLFSFSTPLTIQDIYKAVKLQKYPVIFLSYCVSKLLMWILVPVKDEVIMRCQSVELKEEDLENSSFELYTRYNLLQFLSKDKIYIFRQSAYEQESPFTVLHDVIGIKIIEGLKSAGCSEVTEFIVIPDSVIHLLPFSPLMNKHNWQFFGDKYRIRIVPSFLSLLVMSVTSNPVVEIPGDKSDFLIVGNPTIPQFMHDSTPWNLSQLPYAQKEVISVASVLGTIPVLREQATKQSVLYRLRPAKVIHLATHGSASAGFLAFTSSFPISKSGLAEKEHILIFPKEIETLNISPALVVLSSCDSARRPVKAEGVIGMARAFLSAGAHSVLVSLWRVPDESAHVFMNFFYQFLFDKLQIRVNSYDVESKGCDSLHRCTSSCNTLFLSTSLVECISINDQESFQHVEEPSESSSLNVIGQRIYSPLHAVPTIACINVSDIVTALQDHGILSEKEKSRTRVFDSGSDESSFIESESCNSLYRFASSTTPFLSNSFSESSTNGQESFQDVGEPSGSFSLNVLGQRIYSPFHTILTISCTNLSVNETVLQDGVLTEKHINRTRGYSDGSSDSSSDENNNNGKGERGIHTSLSHYHSHTPQQHSSPRYHSLSAAVNTNITPQTAAGTGLIGSKHDDRIQEIATTKPIFMLPKSPANDMYASKGEHLISDSLTEKGPILLDIPNGCNELVMAAYSTQSIPKLYPIVGLRKELPGIALPPPIPLDLPKIHTIKKVASIASHQQVVREQPVKSSVDVRTVPETVSVQQPQYMVSVASHQQQQAPLSQSMDFSDPIIIIDGAALFLTAGDYGATIKVLETEDIDMAKEFGQGLANYKNIHYKAAKSCFTALFEKSNNYRSPGNQALASIYLGEIEMSWAKYKDADKHFTLAVINYSPDNVAEKYQQTILTKSAVLMKKGQCHWSLSQIKEAISAFKVATKEVAESAQQQARGSKLKTAKEDELSAIHALGNVLQSLGDYDQSFDYYKKSLKLAGELGDQVSIGWAHSDLSNAMLRLVQKDKALDHLMTAFHMSARYEGNPLAVGRVVSKGNSYQVIGNLKKAKEYYEITLEYAIYDNDLQDQGCACGNIGNIYMLLKESVQVIPYHTKTLHLSTDRITGHCDRGCARFVVNTCFFKSEDYRYVNRNNTFNTSFNAMMGNESLQHIPVQRPESLVVNELGSYSAFHIMPCSNVCVNETILQGSVLSQRKVNAVRGSDDESDSSDDENPNQQHKFHFGASLNKTFPLYPNLKQPNTDNSLRLFLRKKVTSTTSYQTGSNLAGIATNNQWQQLTPLDQSVDFSDPAAIISRANLFLIAGDYGNMMKVLETLDKHLVLPDDIDMAKEFGQGLANYKNKDYRAAKTCFTALFEKSSNYHSPGNQALASIYLGEIEMSWAKYKDAKKHFTSAVTNYSSDNVAEIFQLTFSTESAVLVKKGQCHQLLSQIKEAINAFKVAKEVAELAQQQARGFKLKTAKEDELSAVCALGNIMQSLGDYEQSFEYYEKSHKLAGELGDQVSIGWAHGNLGNAMLGLDQKDKALYHLITAFHMSARYEGNPLAVGRAVSNLGNAYRAIGNLPKAKEHYEIALGHAIYGNDLEDQARACGNIGSVHMLLKEPVQAVHYYTETLHLSKDRNTKITGYRDRGCARFDIAECIIQGKKPKELVPATTQDSEYGRLTIKLTDEVITTDPVQETKPNRDPSAQSISEQKESSMSVEMLPVIIKGKTYEGVASVEIVRMAEALPFLETAQRDLLEAIESHEQGVQNIKGSHETLSLSISLFESNSRSYYIMQETLIELGKLCQRLARLGLIDMTAAEPQEFKDALVYGEQARARTLGELILQKKKTMYSDLFSISTPLKIQDIYKAVKLQKYPVIFLSYCVSKLLMWILVPVKDEVIMRCQSVELKEEDLENSSFELYIRYNLLQFLSKDEIHIFRSCAYEQESPFTVLHDVIGIKIIEGLKNVGCSEVPEFIVIPDSVTHLLPFSPLMNKHNWQFFGDKYRIRIVPSFLSLLVMSVTSNPVVEIPGDKSDFLIVGNPTIPYDSTSWNLGRLPYAEKEAISIASVLGTIPVLREQATKQSVLYRLRLAKVIHLATHGSASAGFLAFTSSFPVSKSGLAEKEHILIFPKEIETLNISPALVVLSSCDSARGPVKAEGVIGMARAFLSAGAHSVLVSLWRIPDESAHMFMNFFYQFLVNGLPILQALQRSMQCLRCFLKYSHYVHWSGFQIIGKEVTFHKDSNAQFPIQNMLGEVSIFPRQHVKNMEENLLGVKNETFTDVQVCSGHVRAWLKE